ncbi:hypothetical protein [Aquincola sp. J276]|uniref:hypothetical protein n=1 Tax=Aquincola sp. J276 TaxID=2898432 RepID=UPI0021518734|nr:hypothetical protein [Aquincola sp. J276]MCR5868208.1 hypothetical protein [Aquincola sp. J276]
MHHVGYLNAFALDDALFPLVWERAVLQGFLLSVVHSLDPLLYATVSVLLLAVGSLAAAIFSSADGAHRWQFALWRWVGARFKGRPVALPSEKAMNICTYVAAVAMVVVTLLLLAAFSLNEGRLQAEQERERFANRRGTQVMLSADQLIVPVRAKQLACGASHCAFWLGSEVLILRHEQVQRVLAFNPEINGPVPAVPASSAVFR